MKAHSYTYPYIYTEHTFVCALWSDPITDKGFRPYKILIRWRVPGRFTYVSRQGWANGRVCNGPPNLIYIVYINLDRCEYILEMYVNCVAVDENLAGESWKLVKSLEVLC